ncbi:MAG: phosphoribosylglycinamide formyltransferase [Phycisphaerae bacterium]|nr:phosphoribosylglycinamide formyltransferase [Phycisphaerae bacterium]
MSDAPLQLAILISGGGRTLQNLAEEIQAGRLAARIAKVVCSRGTAHGVSRAAELGLPCDVIERTSCTPDQFDQRIAAAVGGVDLVCMAGFLSLWRFPDPFHGRVINIHPALLPDFGGKGMYGDRVHAAVLAAKRRESGCTVHFCDNQYDHGPVILQRRVPVNEGDTIESLAARVFAAECAAYPEAIRLFIEKRIRLESGRTIIAPP